MTYIVPKELKSPIKVTKFLYLFDILFVLLFMGLSILFGSLVNEKIIFLYYIFSLAVAIILISKSTFNPRKRIYETILYLFKRDGKVYKPITKGDDILLLKSDNSAKYLPFVQYIEDENCFELKNDLYFDVYQISSKDLMSVSEYLIQGDMQSLSGYYRVYTDDVKIITMNFPTDTKGQQMYLRHKIKLAENPIYKERLKLKLRQLEYIELNTSEKEYYLFTFSKGLEMHKKNADTINKFLINKGLSKEITFDKKKQIIFKLNNMNTSLMV